jgi:hypothetical protein
MLLGVSSISTFISQRGQNERYVCNVKDDRRAKFYERERCDVMVELCFNASKNKIFFCNDGLSDHRRAC